MPGERAYICSAGGAAVMPRPDRRSCGEPERQGKRGRSAGNGEWSVARRGPKPFNNPFFEAADLLKKEIKQAHKEKRKARVDASRSASGSARPADRPAPPTDASPSASAADRALFLRAVGPHRDERASRPPDDEAAFLAAVGNATRLEDDPRGQLQPALPPADARHVPVYDEDAEALAELEMLVDGITHFDIADTDEFIEGLAEGVDRRLLTKLRRGEFAVQGHLDLHGMRRDDARQAVAEFIDRGIKLGHRCVRIVHGRGLNSKDKIPVLKILLTSWLERGRVGRVVLAFCTARPNDGGAGAVYVLLRR